MSGAGLYIHIPFCIRKCCYCDFYSIPSLLKRDAFIDALLQEMIAFQTYPPFAGHVFSTLYMGGGTPSLLPPSDMQRILGQAAASFCINKNLEITCEINPGSLTFDHLKNYFRIGINRLSIGFQSLQENELQILSRIHSAQQALVLYAAARAVGFKNIGIDLIYGIPGQTLNSWRHTLKQCIDIQPQHLSIYSLSYEPGTPLTDALQKHEIIKCAENLERDMFIMAQEYLQSAGYEHYEISNFSLPNFRSQHNQKYWDSSPYLGLGPSAHSFDGTKRWWNVADVDAYCSKISSNQSARSGQEQIGGDKARLEFIMLGLRRREGMDLEMWRQQTGEDFLHSLLSTLDDMGGIDVDAKPFGISAKNRLFTVQKNAFCLTRDGLLLYDKVCEKLAGTITASWHA